MIKIVPVFLFIITAFIYGSDNTIGSPDGNIRVTFKLNGDGQPFFDSTFRSDTVMKNNRLGIVMEDADFSKSLKLVSASDIEPVEDSYDLLYGKRIRCVYSSNKKIFHLQNPEGIYLDIIFQISNDGVGFRYFFPETTKNVKSITDELTYFNFNKNTLAWIQPMEAAKSGWNKVNPCYEEHYLQEINVEDLPNSEPGWVFPALFKFGKYWISLTETAPDRNYCGCRLMHDSLAGGFKIGFPQKAEGIFDGQVDPKSKFPWYTPWRIITIGDTLKTLVESTLGTDLAKPAVIKNTSFVKPGRSSWSWVLFKDDSTIYPVQKRFIDYSSEMKWEYCLIDAYWDQKIGYEKIGELCTYAKSKNVAINLWYNSAGDWNTAPLTPRNKLLTKELRDSEFKKIKELGVSGVKVDFFGGDGQSVMSYYEDIMEDAARYGLMVNFHGCTLPRGWERTYPNLVSMEAIKGFEYVTFDQHNADKEANHCTVIPFTRNLFDPMDFTPVCFSEVPNINRKTSNSFELALSVIFLSGIQHFAEVPEGMAKVPAEVNQIMKEVPVAWGESKFIDGYPGKYYIVARRKNNVWYIAGINGGTEEKECKVNLDFIKNRNSCLLVSNGGDNRSFKIDNLNMSSINNLQVSLKPNEGFLARISE
jgi:alpha-glucosidase